MEESILSILKDTDNYLSTNSCWGNKKVKYTYKCRGCGKIVTKLVFKRNTHGHTAKSYCNQKCKNKHGYKIEKARNAKRQRVQKTKSLLENKELKRRGSF